MKFLHFFPLLLGEGQFWPAWIRDRIRWKDWIRIRNTVSIAVIPERCPGCQVPRSLAGCAQDRARLPPDHAARARHLWRKACQISKSNLVVNQFIVEKKSPQHIHVHRYIIYMIESYITRINILLPWSTTIIPIQHDYSTYDIYTDLISRRHRLRAFFSYLFQVKTFYDHGFSDDISIHLPKKTIFHYTP